MTTRVMTANLLRSGLVVFLTADNTWSDKIDDAVVIETDEDAQTLERQGQADIAANLIVDPYLVDATRINGHIKPNHIREIIRTLGPTVHPDHGKQAEGTAGKFTPDDGAGHSSSGGAKLARGKRT